MPTGPSFQPPALPLASRGRAGEAPQSVSALRPTPQTTESGHQNSHFLLGPQESSWEPELSGPKPLVPGSAARSPSLEKLRMIPDPRPCLFLGFCSPCWAKEKPTAPLINSINQTPELGVRVEAQFPTDLTRAMRLSPREPGMTGTTAGWKAVGFLILSQGCPCCLQAPPWALPTTSAPPKPHTHSWTSHLSRK